MVAKPQGTKEWATTIALVFVLAIVGMIFANQYVENFPLGTKTFIFIVIIGVGFFIGIRLLGVSTAEKQLRFEDLAIFGAVIFGLYWLLTNFDLAPEFAIVIRNIASVVGLG